MTRYHKVVGAGSLVTIHETPKVFQLWDEHQARHQSNREEGLGPVLACMPFTMLQQMYSRKPPIQLAHS